MEEYAHRKNIERFENALRIEADSQRRSLLRQLLNNERERLEQLVSARRGRGQGGLR
jgi:DNA-binding TFAR19-related protein (PDSD5 family)